VLCWGCMLYGAAVVGEAASRSSLPVHIRTVLATGYGYAQAASGTGMAMGLDHRHGTGKMERVRELANPVGRTARETQHESAPADLGMRALERLLASMPGNLKAVQVKQLEHIVGSSKAVRVKQLEHIFDNLKAVPEKLLERIAGSWLMVLGKPLAHIAGSLLVEQETPLASIAHSLKVVMARLRDIDSDSALAVRVTSICTGLGTV
jgi:hypothetical protein